MAKGCVGKGHLRAAFENKKKKKPFFAFLLFSSGKGEMGGLRRGRCEESFFFCWQGSTLLTITPCPTLLGE
jgi:hypothetical protein